MIADRIEAKWIDLFAEVFGPRKGGARVGGVWGYTEKPGALSHWPGGLVFGFPKAGSVYGTLVMAPGDLNPSKATT